MKRRMDSDSDSSDNPKARARFELAASNNQHAMEIPENIEITPPPTPENLEEEVGPMVVEEAVDLLVVNHLPVIHVEESRVLDPEDDSDYRAFVSFFAVVDNINHLEHEVTIHSPVVRVRNIPFRIFIQRRGNPRVHHRFSGDDSDSLALFLDIVEQYPPSWICEVQVEFKLMPINADTCMPKIELMAFKFNARERDQGYNRFISFDDLIDPHSGNFCWVDRGVHKIKFHISIWAKIPRGTLWPSRQITGFAGLRNQGVTCYMNSLLQALYCTNAFRRTVYKMPTECDFQSIPFGLQSIFYMLQFTDAECVDTKKLIRSFGWLSVDHLIQQDVQEFLRRLVDHLATYIEDTGLKRSIADLLEGETLSFIRCLNVGFNSSRVELFYDLQIPIQNNRNIYQSFQEYIARETLTDENKYDAGDYGHQDAEKGVEIVKLPHILYLQLMRFQYNPITSEVSKNNSYFEFFDHIDLSTFVSNSTEPITYTLHSVLVHIGNVGSGHYVVYINPKADGHWYKFDDDIVARCTTREAIDENFGSVDFHGAESNSNAYMLVYVKDDSASLVLGNITTEDIPSEVLEHIETEYKLEVLEEAMDFKTLIEILVVLPDYLELDIATGCDALVAPENTKNLLTFIVNRTDTIAQVVNLLGSAFCIANPIERLRMWMLHNRQTMFAWPRYFNHRNVLNEEAFKVEKHPKWVLFLETPPVEAHYEGLDGFSLVSETFEIEQEALIFFKLFNINTQRIEYIGNKCFNLDEPVEVLTHYIRNTMNWPEGTCDIIINIEYSDNTFDFDIIQDREKNDITDCVSNNSGTNVVAVIFEQRIDAKNQFQDYYDEHFNKGTRGVFPKIHDAKGRHPPFILSLTDKTSYRCMVNKVSARLCFEPENLQFFINSPPRRGETTATNIVIPVDFVGTFVDCLKVNHRTRGYLSEPALSYVVIEDIDCLFVSMDLKYERMLNLPVTAHHTASDLLKIALPRREIRWDPSSSKTLRLVQCFENRVVAVIMPSTPIWDIMKNVQKTDTVLRLEQIPDNQLIEDDPQAFLISIYFHGEHTKQKIKHPFLMKSHESETMAEFLQHLQEHLEKFTLNWDRLMICFDFKNPSWMRLDQVDETALLIQLSTSHNPRNHRSCTKSLPGMFIGISDQLPEALADVHL